MRRQRAVSVIRRIHRRPGVFELEIRFQSRIHSDSGSLPPPPLRRGRVGAPHCRILPNSAEFWPLRPLMAPSVFRPVFGLLLGRLLDPPKAENAIKTNCFLIVFKSALGDFGPLLGPKRVPKSGSKSTFGSPGGLKTPPFFDLFF